MFFSKNETERLDLFRHPVVFSMLIMIWSAPFWLLLLLRWLRHFSTGDTSSPCSRCWFTFFGLGFRFLVHHFTKLSEVKFVISSLVKLLESCFNLENIKRLFVARSWGWTSLLTCSLFRFLQTSLNSWNGKVTVKEFLICWGNDSVRRRQEISRLLNRVCYFFLSAENDFKADRICN